jgi:hypothetical protein
VTVELRRLTPAAEEGWVTLFDLARETTKEWVLVGGQMMLAPAVEHGAERIRPTEDIDIVVNLRVRPDGTEWFSRWLVGREFVLEGVNVDEIGHRFVRPTSSGQGRVIVDVLAPAGVGERARLTTVPPARTVQAPGTLQAFERSRLMDVLISGFSDDNERIGQVRCPDLLGALIAKAAATTIAVRANPDRDWQDLALLLSVLADPIATMSRLNRRDLQHLGRVRPLLDPRHRGWENLSEGARQRGIAALGFLIEGSNDEFDPDL